MHWSCASVFVVCMSVAFAEPFCSDLLATNKTKFYPIRHCQRSNKTRIAAKNVSSLEKCAQFAEFHRGLAFNFGHGQKPRRILDQNFVNLFDFKGTKNKTNLKVKTISDEPYFNCEVLDCSEAGNMSAIINDTRYDYYSMYGNVPGNATCLPTIGIFMFYYEDRMNYSEAGITCENHGGYLADVMSDTRTNYLSSLVNEYSTNLQKNAVLNQPLSNLTYDSLKRLPIHHAFIGLRELRRKDSFLNLNDIPAHCYKYRAWAPRYPIGEKEFGCVAITDSRSWKIFDCRKRMPFICELKPSKPRKKRRFNRRCSLRRPNN